VATSCHREIIACPCAVVSSAAADLDEYKACNFVSTGSMGRIGITAARQWPPDGWGPGSYPELSSGWNVRFEALRSTICW
jgi:hypothetical protein